MLSEKDLSGGITGTRAPDSALIMLRLGGGDDEQEPWWKHAIDSTFPQEQIEREPRRGGGG